MSPGLILPAALLTLGIGLLIVWPLLRPGKAVPGRRDYDLSVYDAQLREIDADLAAGRIDEDAAETARAEVKRRILDLAETPVPDTDRPEIPPRPALGVTLFIALALIGGGGYAVLGSPDLSDQPFAKRMAAASDLPDRAMRGEFDIETATPEELGMLADAMRTRLTDGDVAAPQPWLVLSDMYGRAGRIGDAIDAVRAATERGYPPPEAFARIGAISTGANDGIVDMRAREAFRAALTRDPNHAESLYYLGLARLQEDDPAGAIAVWKELETRSPAEAPWLNGISDRMEFVAESAGLDIAVIAPQHPVPPEPEKPAASPETQPPANSPVPEAPRTPAEN